MWNTVENCKNTEGEKLLLADRPQLVNWLRTPTKTLFRWIKTDWKLSKCFLVSTKVWACSIEERPAFRVGNRTVPIQEAILPHKYHWNQIGLTRVHIDEGFWVKPVLRRNRQVRSWTWDESVITETHICSHEYLNALPTSRDIVPSGGRSVSTRRVTDGNEVYAHVSKDSTTLRSYAKHRCAELIEKMMSAM